MSSHALNRALAQFPMVYSLHRPDGVVIAVMATQHVAEFDRWLREQCGPCMRAGGVVIAWRNRFPSVSFSERPSQPQVA